MSRKALSIGMLLASVVLAPSLAFGAATAYVEGRTKMYSGPDTDYPTVATVRRGEGVVIHGCLRNREWCDVGFRGERGWMRADRIEDRTVRGRVPLLSSGRELPTVRFQLDEYWDTNYHGRYDRRRGHWQNYYRDRYRD